MSACFRVSRVARIPDPIRLERCLRLPELGPRVLFFSGGTALRSISRRLKHYTHNSIHLITPFDSGGSSAKLRDAFGMLAVGDLRNRLIALADESVKGSPEICTLFSHRLSATSNQPELLEELHAMIAGQHPLVANIDEPMRRLIQTHLRNFAAYMPDDFDLRIANIGNLLLAGGHLANERDIQSVIFLFSKLVEVRGTVRPVVEGNYHLAADLYNHESLVGQHNITSARHPGIKDIYLVAPDDLARRAATQISADVQHLIETADLICYPAGSFYTSVIANLLPGGVGTAIANSRCPKVYLPNLGTDAEQVGMTLKKSVEAIIRHAKRDRSEPTSLTQIIDIVLVDSRTKHLRPSTDIQALREMGVTVQELPLSRRDDATLHDPDLVTEALLSIA